MKTWRLWSQLNVTDKCQTMQLSLSFMVTVFQVFYQTKQQHRTANKFSALILKVKHMVKVEIVFSLDMTALQDVVTLATDLQRRTTTQIHEYNVLL